VDRRIRFFLVGAAVCFLLVPAALPEHQALAAMTGVVYLTLALLSALEAFSRSRR
jgi:hypothetical protein